MHSRKLMFKVNDLEADQFAAEFLMPAAAIRRELTPPITLTLLAKLKPRWKVPLQALIDRAKHLQILTERQVRYLLQQLSSTWLEEPVQLRPERARGLRQLAEILYGDPIDYCELAAITSLNPENIKEIVGWCRSKGAPRAIR